MRQRVARRIARRPATRGRSTVSRPCSKIFASRCALLRVARACDLNGSTFDGQAAVRATGSRRRLRTPRKCARARDPAARRRRRGTAPATSGVTPRSVFSSSSNSGFVPDRLAVAAPEAVERPARQLFARIPLALAEVRQSLRRVLLLEAVVELDGEAALVGPHRRGVPLRAVRIVDRNERGLAAHGQAHVARQQLRVDVMARAFRSPSTAPRCTAW